MDLDEPHHARHKTEGRATTSFTSPDHPRDQTDNMSRSRYDHEPSTSSTTRSSYMDENRRYENAAPASARPYTEPPPLAPYVTDEQRVHPPRISDWGAVPDPGVARYQANPNPNRPPPIHNPPKGSNWRRQIEQPPMRSPSFSQRTSPYTQASYHPHPYHSPNDTAPRASSSRVQLPPFSTLPGASSMQRSRSSRSQQSIPMSRAQSQNGSSHSFRSSGNSSTSMMDGNDDSNETWTAGASPMFDNKRRTRALMTKSQMSELKRLWRKTKFPGNEEREGLGQRIGLTPRQVQVWFQNQRQKIRKEINESKVPANANPQDYVDLDKSPRSRKLTLEASASGSNDRPSATSTSSSDMSGSSLRLQVSGLGLQTPRDDDSRSIATGSSSGHHHTTTPDTSYTYTTTSGPSGYWDQSRTSSHHQSPSDQHQPFAFHKPPTPSMTPRPAPYPNTNYDYLNPHLDSRHSYGVPPSIPHPPLRHANTIDGEILSRRRSNSLVGMRPSIQSEREFNSRSAQSVPEPRTHTNTASTTSGLPPSLAALVLPGPVHTHHDNDQPIGTLPRFTSDQGAPTLPPPRGWTPERPESQVRSQTDPNRGRLPAYRSMFGRGGASEHTRR